MSPPVHRMASARLWLACGVGWLVLAAGLAVAWHRVAERRFVRELEETAARGFKFYTRAIWGAGGDRIYGPGELGFPRWNTRTDAEKEEYRNVRDFIVQCVTGGHFVVDWAFFAAPGVPAARGGPENFGSTNHAWRIVTDIGEPYPEESPVLWTKNLTITNIGQRLSRDAQGLPAQLAEIPPFGRKGFVFIVKGCRAHVLYGDQLRFDAFTNAFHFRHLEGPNAPGPEPEALTNRVLDP